ncbi:MAG: universal stress protein [Methylocella sp.]
MRSLLAVLTHECSAAACLRGADAAAAVLNAQRIDVLHVRVAPLATIVVAAEILTESQNAQIEAGAAREAEALKTLFDAWGRERVQRGEDKSLPEIAWLDVTGSPYEEVARRGREADLIVIGAPASDADVEGRQVLRAAIFDTGRPFLRVPARLSGPFGGHVAVAWKEGEAARRAVTAGLPWLKRAERISVIIAEEAVTAASAAAGVLALLASHGLAAQLVTAPRGHTDIGATLLSEADRLGADLLVMGAYRRPRLVELVLGGATVAILRQAMIPLLMQH